MTNEPSSTPGVDERDGATASKSTEMREADTANGENPDDDDESSPAKGAGDTTFHSTGERQARENRENDPPA